MLCIICNEHPEKDWPKRWQCWKENGKFSESLCKLLGLPKFPYKEDFQNSVYCSSCQKRVYNVYLMVRKWERVQDEINKLKVKLKKDFQQSLQKGCTNGSKKRSKGKQSDKSTWIHLNGSNNFERENDFKLKTIFKKENGINDKVDETEAQFELMVIRKRILQRLDKRNWDCDCCFDSQPQAPTKKYPPVEKGKLSLPPCGFPDCQDKECLKWKRNTHNNNRSGSESDDDNGSSSSGSDSDSSRDHENRCSDEFCTTCNSSPEGPQEESDHAATTSMKTHQDSTTHSNSKNKMTPCSSEYCADCAICKDEARRSSKNSGKSKRDCDNTANNDNTFANKEASAISIKNEVVSGAGSPDESETLDFESFGKMLSKDSPSQSTGKTLKQENCSTDTDVVSPTAENEEDGSADGDNNVKYEYAERFRCNKSSCTRTFVTQDDLEIHVKRHHEGIKCPYLCQQCGKAFQWRRELTAHVFKHSGEVAICCHICGRGFRTLQLFNVHMKTKHGGERKFKCSACEKSFISESKLNTHLTIHTKVYPFACTICGKGFSAKTFLNFHMSKHMDANPYQCAICSKTFSSPRNLKVHQYTHTQSHPFKCPVCQAGATSETLLKKHMLKHNSEKSNVCHTCNKKFRFPSSLKKHQKVHNGEKRFKCEFCNKTFIDKYKLTRHLRTHSGDKPFHCSKCKKSFSTKEYLNKHNIQNHEKDPEIHSSSSIKDNDITSTASSSSSFDKIERPLHNHQTSSSSPDDLQLPEINQPLSAYLPDDFTSDPSFLDTLNPADADLVVTALDLENFSKEELMLTGERSESPSENFPGDVPSENLVPHSNMLPDFQSFRRSSTNQSHNEFSFTYHQL